MIWKLLALFFGVVAVMLGIPAVRHLREVPPPAPPIVRAQLAVPSDVILGSGGDPLDAAISPDEQQIAFVATRAGSAELWVLAMASGVSSPIKGTEGAAMPAWNRDGRQLAFFAQGQLRAVDVTSGAISTLADAAVPGGVAWQDDGSVVFAGDARASIRKLTAGVASDITKLAEGDVSHGFPFVDDAGRLVYVAQRSNGARVVRLVTGEGAVDLTETSGHAELRGGMLVHVRDNVLLAQRLDEGGTRLVGRSAALATNVGRSERGHAFFAASRRMVLWTASPPRPSELVWFDSTGQRLSAATEPGDYWQVRLSPDEGEAAVTAVDPLLRTLDVMVVPLAAPGNARRISLNIGPDTDPVWAPNGTTLLYRSAQSGPGALVSRPSSSSPEPETVVLRKRAELTPSDWRGDTILFHGPGEGGTRMVSALIGKGETTFTRPGFNSWDARWSRDGAWVAYTSDEGGQAEIYVQAWPNGSPRVRATFGGGQRPQWGAGETLFFLRGNAVMRASLTGGPTPLVSTPQVVFTADGVRDFALSQRDGRFLVVGAAPNGDVPEAHLIFEWATLVPPPPTAPPKL